MIRVLVFLVVMAALALGAAWLIEHPGQLLLTWQDRQYETTLPVAILLLVLAMIGLAMAWRLLRGFFGLPQFLGFQARRRKQVKGMTALSRGIMAVGAGDSRAAQRHADEATKHLGREPLTLLLKAQAAQLSGDRATAEATFSEMVGMPDTRLVGLRGLHVEARRRGDTDKAHKHAVEAHRLSGLPWSGQAVVEHRVRIGDWAGALAALERQAGDGHLDRASADRGRAVLKTAMALEKTEQAPTEALRLAREAIRLAPDLTPAAVVAGQLSVRQGELRRAIKILEQAWRVGPHPDLAETYLHVRHGDSASDRLARAKTLARIAPDDPESILTIARAAIDAREFDLAREAMTPLVDGTRGRPTVRACLTMADIEEVSSGAAGKVREWLARAARAPRDPIWIADGVASDHWAPVSPVTGRLDAFVWRAPSEQLIGPTEGMLALNGRPNDEALAPPPAMLPLPSHGEQLQAVPAVPILEKIVVGPEDVNGSTQPANGGRLSELTTPSPQPVVFPLAAAPDDPGPEPMATSSQQRFGLTP
jgi:HemY protein